MISAVCDGLSTMLKLGVHDDWAGELSRQGELANERSSAEGTADVANQR